MPVRVPRLDDQGRLVLGALPDLATASTTQKGLVELATTAETQTGTDTTRAVTPAALSATVAAQAFDATDVGDDVWVLLGQSNEVGYGTGGDSTYLDPSHPRVFQFAGSGTYVGQRITAFDPLFHHEQKGAGTIGHAMTFARTLVPTLRPNRSILLVPCAHGGTGFSTTSLTSGVPAGYHSIPQGAASGGWDPSGAQGGTNLYAYAVAQTLAALALSPNNRIAGFIWHGGEADAGYLNQSQYAAAIDNLVTLLRAAIPGAAQVPFLLGQMVDYNIINNTGYAAVNAAHVDTPRRLTRTAFFYGPATVTDATMQIGDNLHYSAKGQRVLAKNAIDALALAKVNVLGGGAPSVPGTPVLVQSGPSVTATWARPTNRVTDYHVRYSIDGGGSWTALTRAQSIDVSATIPGLTLGSSVQVQAQAVNEDGSSAWSGSGTLTLVTAPAAPTGVTAGTPTTAALPVSWSAVSTATSYLIEYKATSSGTWLAGPTVTGTTGTVTGLTPETSYDARVKAINAAGNGPASSSVTAVTAAPSVLITDVGSAAFRAHGLRKLNASYAGNCVLVRRSTDNTTQAIGFSGNNLDTAALLAFAGSGDAFIATWYDQSGNTRDFTQATAAKQPRIVLGGALSTLNGKPAAWFDGTDDEMASSSAGLYAAGAATVLSVLAGDAAGAGFEVAFAELGSTARYNTFVANSPVASGTYVVIRADDGTYLTQNGGTGASLVGGARRATFTDTGSSAQVLVDQVVSQTNAYSRTGKTLTLTSSLLGSLSTVNFWKGYIAEVIGFGGTVTTGSRQAGEANQKAYYTTA